MKDGEVAELAARQDGVFARWQVGMTRGEINHRLRTGRWHFVHRGVYAFTPDVRGRGRLRAAVLTFGPASVGALRLAGHLWAWRTRWGSR